MSIEVRDPVHGTISLTDGETSVVDSREFQRLRAIKQLVFADVSFPGATHTRFLHSIGVCHLAGLVFEQIFKDFKFSSAKRKQDIKQAFRLGALLHDVGHGPLSHTTENVMPTLADLELDIYKRLKPGHDRAIEKKLRATHEDYTLKFLTDSPLAEILKKEFPAFTPDHVACLIDKSLTSPDQFFVENGLDLRPILSQLVSSELDVDRMDYLERDSYFTGTNYGKIDLSWLLSNITYHILDKKAYLALNRRALYTFDDFLISRHHAHLMVYFHHKVMIYEEMINEYLTSPDCKFVLPSKIEEYTKYNDFKLYEHLSEQKNEWAQRISFRRPYKNLIELHNLDSEVRMEKIKSRLAAEKIHSIYSSSKTRLSKYHASQPEERSHQIYVVDQYDRRDEPTPIDRATEVFKRYEGARSIDRLYVAPENFSRAESIVVGEKL